MKFKDPLLKSVLEAHDFPSPRGLNDYIELFGFPFAQALKDLEGRDHWLDAGAGELLPMKEFYQASTKKDVYTTGITLKISGNILRPSHKTVVNYVEDLAIEAVRSSSVITDVEGPLQYTENPDQVLKKYLLWMKPEGKLFIYLSPGSASIEMDSGEMELTSWISNIPGLIVHSEDNAGALIISKENSSHAIPRLKLLSARMEEGVIIRKFRQM